MTKIFLILFLVPVFGWSQDTLTTGSSHTAIAAAVDTSSHQRIVAKNYLREDVWRIDFLGPGYLNEHRLGKLITLVSELRLVGSFRVEDWVETTGRGYSYNVKKVLAFSINPELSVAVRQFYNLAKRKEAGKSIRYNSGSYFALKGNYVAPPLYKNTNIDIEGAGLSLLWGVQYTARKYFYTNLELGVGTAQYYENSVSPTGNLILGYTF